MKKLICSVILGLLLISNLVWSNAAVQADISVNDMDLDNNGRIDIIDLANVANYYNMTSNDTKWNSKYDFNGDKIIDIYDIVKITKAIGTIFDNADITSKFTDENFKKEVYARIGKTSPAPILYSDVKSIQQLDVSRKDISNMSGIEHFTSLADLSCGINQITILDVSKNTELTGLDCSSNQLRTLDVSENTALTGLDCDSNQLTTLDVSKNIVLAWLDCGSNKLTALDVSENTAVAWLYCSSNQLSTIDVRKNTALIELDCSSNQLTALDVSENTAVAWLYCSSNQLTTLNVSRNINLEDFNCLNNELKTLYSSVNEWTIGNYKTQYIDESRTSTNEDLVIQIDISAKFIDENFRNAVYERVGKTSPSPILDTDVKDLTYLDLSQKDIADASGIECFKGITSLYCSYNQKLETLDLSKNTALISINCSGNKLKSLDVSGNTALTWLLCSYNNLQTLDVSSNLALTNLSCNRNNLTTLDVSKNTELTNLSCAENRLQTLDVSLNQTLEYFNCSYNQLKTLYASNHEWIWSDYKTQYTDASHKATTTSLIITIKN